MIVVILKAVDHIECVFKSSGPRDLTLIHASGNELTLPKLGIREVIMEDYDDRVRNGTLIGVAIGFAGPVLVTLASGVDRTEIPFGFIIGTVGACVGAAVGWQLDKRRRGTEVLCRAP